MGSKGDDPSALVMEQQRPVVDGIVLLAQRSSFPHTTWASFRRYHQRRYSRLPVTSRQAPQTSYNPDSTISLSSIASNHRQLQPEPEPGIMSDADRTYLPTDITCSRRCYPGPPERTREDTSIRNDHIRNMYYRNLTDEWLLLAERVKQLDDAPTDIFEDIARTQNVRRHRHRQ